MGFFDGFVKNKQPEKKQVKHRPDMKRQGGVGPCQVKVTVECNCGSSRPHSHSMHGKQNVKRGKDATPRQFFGIRNGKGITL